MAALGLVALSPTESKADQGFSIQIGPGYPQYRPYYYGGDHYRYYLTRTNTGGTNGSDGTGTIIRTITIETIIGTTIGIDVMRGALHYFEKSSGEFNQLTSRVGRL